MGLKNAVEMAFFGAVQIGEFGVVGTQVVTIHREKCRVVVLLTSRTNKCNWTGI